MIATVIHSMEAVHLFVWYVLLPYVHRLHFEWVYVCDMSVCVRQKGEVRRRDGDKRQGRSESGRNHYICVQFRNSSFNDIVSNKINSGKRFYFL